MDKHIKGREIKTNRRQKQNIKDERKEKKGRKNKKEIIKKR